MKIQKYLITAGMLVLLAGCGLKQQPQIPLEEKLVGKNADERKQILTDECKAEARQRVVWKRTAHSSYLDRYTEFSLMDVCNNMYKKMKSENYAGKKDSVAKECYGQADYKAGGLQRSKDMKALCDKIIKEIK